MKTKICTDIDQSKKLIELGIDPNTADMYLDYQPDGYVLIASELGYYNNDSEIPAWSLSALLNIMPRTISIRVDDRSANFYRLEWQFANDNSLRYIGSDRQTLIDIYSDHDSEYNDDIDTAVEMIIWLKEHNHIKK